ncbi:DUF6544 family protein [Paenibacillus campinasensis]|uniref:Uncharacterized protein n=1 Tax=Paenibacillus campinasensis TaxID=66347 RepID=A0A268ETM2_9BACL|nr:DUF6544 family protein [Paenibacillus campinasensis]PAD76475.1 hypothetical protein CHH67_12735 [Paenibacillus campinasensis]
MYWLWIAAVISAIIISLIIGIAARNRAYRAGVAAEEARLLRQAPLPSSFLQPEEDRLRKLPPPVARWLKLTGALDQTPFSSVHIRQKGMLRTQPDGRWMPFLADQHSLLAAPAFIWKAKIRAAPGVAIYGRDLYADQHADMLIKLMGILTAAHARGPEVDQGSLVRYLAEIVWYPPAALSPNMTWEALGPDAARASISYGGAAVSGIFYFQESGEPVRFEAQRYMDAGGTFRLEAWSVRMEAYRKFQGILVPSRGEVSWQLETGPFHWLHFEVTDAQFG